MSGNNMNISMFFKGGQYRTLSNVLSGLRLLLGIALYFLILSQNLFGAILLGLLAILSDYADGYFARKRNEITELGKILDPLADKFAVAVSGIALYQAYGLPLWVVLVIIGRDVLIVCGSLVLMQKVQQVESSEIPGKIAVTVIALLLLSYLLKLTVIQRPLLVLTVLSLIISFSYYISKFVRRLSQKVTPGEQ